MLDKDVVDNSKSCAEYFEFFKNYASYVSDLMGAVPMVSSEGEANVSSDIAVWLRVCVTYNSWDQS